MSDKRIKVLFNSSAMVIGVTFLMKAFGLVREMALSHYFGASSITDAYNIAQTIPITLFEYVTFAIGIAYIPVFTNIKNRYSMNKSFRFSNMLIWVCIIFATVLNLVIQLFTPVVVSVFAKGFSGDTLSLAINFTRIISWNVYFLVIADVLGGYLQIKNKYLIVVLASLPYDLVIIVSIIFAQKNDINILAYGVILATVAKMFFMVTFAKKEKYRFLEKPGGEHFSEFLHLILPVVAIVISEQVNTIIDRTIASSVMIGGITYLAYADKINVMFRQLLARPIALMIYPSLCEYASKQDKEKIKAVSNKGIRYIILLIIPVTAGLQILSYPLVKLLFGHGAFTEQNCWITSRAVIFYAFGLCGYSVREVLSRILYSEKNSRLPLINSCVCVCVNVILNVILARSMGIMGLALATSIAGIISAIHLAVVITIKYGKTFFEYRLLGPFVLKVIAATAIMGICILVLGFFMEGIIYVISAFMLGVLTYFMMCYMMGIDEVSKVIDRVLKKKRKGI